MRPSPSPPRAVAIGLLVAALLASGCGLFAPSTPPVSRELASAQFADIPAPRGFVLSTSDGLSYTYAEGGGGPAALRMGRLVYTGTTGADDVAAFYEEQMPRPLYGWTASERIPSPPGVSAILFSRGDDRCLVTARVEGGRTSVTVERNAGAALRGPR